MRVQGCLPAHSAAQWGRGDGQQVTRCLAIPQSMGGQHGESTPLRVDPVVNIIEGRQGHKCSADIQ